MERKAAQQNKNSYDLKQGLYTIGTDQVNKAGGGTFKIAKKHREKKKNKLM